MKSKIGLAFIMAIGILLFSHFNVQQAEAKGFYGSDLGQTYAVFTMIALAIAGFGILLAIYSRETMKIKKR